MRVRGHTAIFAGMLLGAGAGACMWGSFGKSAAGQDLLWFFDLFGTTIFVGLLKMIVAPLIFFSILAGVTSLPSSGELWRIGWRTLLYYLATTSIAVAIGLLFVLSIQPGKRGDREAMRRSWAERQAEIGQRYGDKEKRVASRKGKSVRETIRENIETIVTNPFKALTDGNSLAIIFFALLLGIALVTMGAAGKPVVAVVQGVNTALLRLTAWVLWPAPFFLFCLIAALLARHGPEVFASLAWYVGCVLVAIAVHVCVLLALCKVLGRRSPLEFLKGIRRAWAVAFATRSSAATLPVTMKAVTQELSVSPKIADFVLPLGATANMDGTALYEGVAVIFLIQLFGGLPGVPSHLGLVMTGVIFLTAVLASIGAAAVPDAGLVTMVLVANAVGLDVTYIGLVFAVDAFLDMFRTSTNVMGDAVGAVVVARFERGHLGDAA